MEDNKEQLKKLSRMFSLDKIVSQEDIAEVLKAIIQILANNKKENVALNAETKKSVTDLLNRVVEENNKILLSVNRETLEAGVKISADFSTKLKEIKALIKTVEQIKPKDGKNADEETIVDKVLAKIKLPEQKEIILDDGGRIKSKLELLKEDERLDMSAVKGIDKSQKNLLEFLQKWSIGILDQRTQFLINKVSNLQISVDNAPHGVGSIGIGVTTITGGTPSSILTVGASGTLSQIASDGMVNVLDYGAIGNGIADDTAAFNAAIAAVPVAGGTVLVPPGTYAINILINRPKIRLIGSHIGRVSSGTNRAGLVPFDITQPVVTISNDTQLNQGVQLQNLELNGRALGYYGLKIRGGSYSQFFDNITIQEFTKKGLWITTDTTFPVAYLYFNGLAIQPAITAAHEHNILIEQTDTANFAEAIFFNNVRLAGHTVGYAVEISGSANTTWTNSWFQVKNGAGVLLSKPFTTESRLNGNGLIIDSDFGTDTLVRVSFGPGVADYIESHVIGFVAIDGYVDLNGTLRLNQSKQHGTYLTKLLYNSALGTLAFADAADPNKTTIYIAGNTTTDTLRIVAPNGVGIGTTVPTTNFQVTQDTVGSGTVSNSAGGTTVTGVGTLFLNTFKIGDTITINGETVAISAIASNTSMTTAAITGANAAVAYTLVGGTRFSVLGNGNVGVGTTIPATPLQVAGAIRSTRTTAADQYVELNGGDASGMYITASSPFASNKPLFINVSVPDGGPNTNTGIQLQIDGTTKFIVDESGNVGIGGTTTPTAVLQLKAGAAAISSAPLKFTAGTNLTTTEAGAIEFDGTNLYFTATNGGSRFTLNSSIISTLPILGLLNTGVLDTAKFNSVGVAWSADATLPAIVFNGSSTQRPEIAWIRSLRTYPEFAIRENVTSDTGGTIYSGTGLVVPVATMTFNVGNVGIGIVSPQSKLHTRNSFLVNDTTSGAFTVAKFNSQGVAWSGDATLPSIVFNGDSGHRPEISWIRGARTYPEFSIRQHTTADKGGTIYSGTGLVAPIATMSFSVGLVGIGITAPTAVLHLQAGTATASTAPLKFTSGVLLTAPEAGVIEFLTDALYFTKTTGPTRLPIITADSTTVGQVPTITGTNTYTWQTPVVTASGVYTPTFTNVANLATITGSDAQYLRVGNTVTVSGNFVADPTLTATVTTFGISLPVASAFASTFQCGGTAVSGAIAGMAAEINADVANDRANVSWVASDPNNQTWSYTFTYRIL